MTPTWFGPEDASLFGWFHSPTDLRVRGIVVLCPPVGIEMLITYRTMRILADRLAAAGVGVLRFAYPSTGDSAGVSTDPDRVERWLDSVPDAVAWVRQAGAPRVVVAGMRLGATLAAAAAASRSLTPVDGMVLWDPCESGTSFLKEEHALFRFGVPASQRTPHAEGSIEGPGVLYPAEVVATLGRVRVGALLGDPADPDPTRAGGDTVLPGVGRVLVVTRSESRPRAGIRRLTDADGVETVEAPGQPALFDWARLAVPVEAVDRITEWVSRFLPDEPGAVVPPVREAAVVATTGEGHAVRERVVRIGEAGLFGILTEIDGPGGATVVLTNAAPPACHIGPARLWVDLARSFAPRGVRVLRFDDAGIGDSPGGDELADPPSYTEEPVRNIVAAVEAARADGARDVSLTGLCSAAWACLSAAARIHVEAVNALNPAVWDVRPPLEATQPQAAGPTPAPQPERVKFRARLRGVARRGARRLLPEALWWRLARRGHIEAPAGMITPLLLEGTRVRLLFGHHEAARFRERRGQRLVDRFGARGLLETHEGADIDHALMSLSARDAVAGQLSEWLERSAAAPPARGPHPRPRSGPTTTP